MPKKNIQTSIRYSFLIAMLIMTPGCKITKPANTNNADQYFTVSLYSIGTGIDQLAKNVVVNTIDKYTQKGYVISYSAVPWGREGEVDYCFELQKLDGKVYTSFFDEISALLKDKQVHIKEKVPCRSNY